MARGEPISDETLREWDQRHLSAADPEAMAREIRHQLDVSRSHADSQMRRVDASIAQLGALMSTHGSSVHDLVTNRIPSAEPGLEPDASTLREARRLDELISVRNLPPIRPATLLTRIITQRI